VRSARRERVQQGGMIERINGRDRDKGSTNVSVGHMWVPRGLIRSAGPLIYAIVNPVKLCHKYRLMPPLRPADVITAEPALHNFCSPSSTALFSVFLVRASRTTRVPVSVVYLVRRQWWCSGSAAQRPRSARPFLFSPGVRCDAHIRALEIPNHPSTLPFCLSEPSCAEPTLSRFKSIMHS